MSGDLRSLIPAVLWLGIAGGASAETACYDAPDFRLVLEGPAMALESEGACLGAILDDLVRRTSMRVELPPGLGARPVAAAFAGLPAEQGLRRILEGTDYLLSREDSAEAAAIPLAAVSLQVLSAQASAAPRSGGGESPEEDGESLWHLAETARASARPEARGYEIQLLMQAGDSEAALDAARSALGDARPETRRAALGALDDLGTGAAPVAGAVAEIALYDPEPELRKLALHRLFGGAFPRAAVTDTLAAARADSDPEVGALAARLLALTAP